MQPYDMKEMEERVILVQKMWQSPWMNLQNFVKQQGRRLSEE